MTNSSAAAQIPLDDVAVLMPAYNGQADVDLTLASFSETAPIHVLIVDDGSTPPIVAPVIANMTIEVLRMPQNGGIERALQSGIDTLAERGFRYAAPHRRGRPQRAAAARQTTRVHGVASACGRPRHVDASRHASRQTAFHADAAA
ncbi:hypothetical protein GGD41_005830 [Paraburkholderia bryophila]|uniref:Glycosyltransferase 2-like domain-containing protein n=1 Tax=Paraburkholderia bryophila TaxID=420952 RepID=A0A7Y9WDB3_9BURK|nr:hypothetical protein [Paraburkholderia bryophila]